MAARHDKKRKTPFIPEDAGTSCRSERTGRRAALKRPGTVRILSLILALLLALSACRGKVPGSPESPAESGSESSAQPASESSAQPAPESSAEPASETNAETESETQESAEPTEPAVLFSAVSGIYEENELRVVLTAPEGYTVCYTVDGSAPTIENDTGEKSAEVLLKSGNQGYLVSHGDEMIIPGSSSLFENETLPAGTVLFAALADREGNVTALSGQVYFLGEDPYERYPDTLILSIIADPDDLLDYETGILATGRFYDEWKKQPEAAKILEEGSYYLAETNSTQRGKDWERRCLIQIYDGEASPAVAEAAGMRITGGMSRMFSQKSFNIYMRAEYGSKQLDYELFEGVNKLKGFRIRSGGNNTDWLKFKDAYLMELAEGRDVDRARTGKAVLFINGEYWGPYVISERITQQMLSGPYGLDKDQVVIIKEAEVEEGEDEDIRLYEELMSYAEKDLTDPAAYGELSEIMDLQSFADYCAVRIYVGDRDWGFDKNEILWRTRDDSFDGGRWHWLLYDIEYSSGMYGGFDKGTMADHDHFTEAIGRHPLFAALIQNRDFYEMFLEAIKEIGSENYAAERAGRLLDAYLAEWEPLMADYYLRFGDPHLWEWGAQGTRDFFEQRYDLLIPIVEAYGS